VTPALIIAPRGFLELESLRRGLFGVTVRAAFERGAVSNVAESAGTASFVWTFGALEMCTLRWEHGPWALSPCVRVEAGELLGTGTSATMNDPAKRGWVAIDLLARARFLVLPHAWLEVEAGGRAPLIRDSFLFDPSSVYYHPPAVGGFVGADGRVAF
jgi:hypothetical protein